jgi:hypothetical protein
MLFKYWTVKISKNIYFPLLYLFLFILTSVLILCWIWVSVKKNTAEHSFSIILLFFIQIDSVMIQQYVWTLKSWKTNISLTHLFSIILLIFIQIDFPQIFCWIWTASEGGIEGGTDRKGREGRQTRALNSTFFPSF